MITGSSAATLKKIGWNSIDGMLRLHNTAIRMNSRLGCNTAILFGVSNRVKAFLSLKFDSHGRGVLFLTLLTSYEI